MPIVFISALIGILQHIKVLPYIIKALGFLLSVNGMGKLESFNAISALMVGQSENFITYKNICGVCLNAVCIPLQQRQCRQFRCLSSAHT